MIPQIFGFNDMEEDIEVNPEEKKKKLNIPLPKLKNQQ